MRTGKPRPRAEQAWRQLMLLHRAHMCVCAMAPRLTGERDRHILLQDSQSEWPGKPDKLEPSLTASQTMAAKCWYSGVPFSCRPTVVVTLHSDSLG